MTIEVNILQENIKEELNKRVCQRVQKGDRHSCFDSKAYNLEGYCDSCLFKCYLEEERLMNLRYYHHIIQALNELPKIDEIDASS